ncbi:MAG: hypothetical protein ABSH08_18905 [Tepidisphaeraceae bacterium]|jgi:hypothetical protein
MTPPLLLEIDPITKWAAIILGILTILYATMRPWFRKRDPLEKPHRFGSLAQQRSVEREMQNVLVELSEMARQITAQIDTRSARLEALIRQADERIAAMNAPPPAKASQAPPASLPPEPSDSPAIDPRYAQVYALADQGRSSKDIAQQLNRPSGEIELILALRR